MACENRITPAFLQLQNANDSLARAHFRWSRCGLLRRAVCSAGYLPRSAEGEDSVFDWHRYARRASPSGVALRSGDSGFRGTNSLRLRQD